VLQAVASTAARLCDVPDAVIYRVDGDVLQLAARRGSIPVPAVDDPIPVNRATVVGRSAVDRQTVRVDNLATADETEFPLGRAYATAWGTEPLHAVA
jgi:hypothetical protein